MCGAAILAKKLKPPSGPVSPLEILESSYTSMDAGIIGSTTECIISVDLLNSKFLYSNLGDSGFMLIRRGKIVKRTEEQLHGFNCPYQLGNGSTDLPIHASVGSVDIEPGDILLVATDGVFDNVSDTELCDHINNRLSARQQHQQLNLSRNNPPSSIASNSNTSYESLAESIAMLARSAASDQNRNTPFAEYSAAHGYYRLGGKEDDITVVVTEFKDVMTSRAERMRPKL
jgi:protein phosphatase PTC7